MARFIGTSPVHHELGSNGCCDEKLIIYIKPAFRTVHEILALTDSKSIIEISFIKQGIRYRVEMIVAGKNGQVVAKDINLITCAIRLFKSNQTIIIAQLKAFMQSKTKRKQATALDSYPHTSTEN